MTILEQLELWVKGDSIHNTERDECCPDFSCCRPDLRADIATREAFAKAYREHDHSTVDGMLVGFLALLLKSSGCEVSTSADVIKELKP